MTSALLDQFVTEGRDLLDDASAALLRLETLPDDTELINTAFRALHTLKGASGLFDCVPLTRLVHVGEDVLTDVRSGALPLEAPTVDLLLSALDQVGVWLRDLEEVGALPASAEAIAAPIVEALDAIHVRSASSRAPTLPDAPCVATADSWLGVFSEADRLAAMTALAEDGGPVHAVRYEPNPHCFFGGDDPLLLIARIPDRIIVRAEAVTPWPEPAAFDPYICNLRFFLFTRSARGTIADIFEYVTDETDIRPVDFPDLVRPAGTLDDVTSVRVFVAACRAALTDGGLAAVGALVDDFIQHAPETASEAEIGRAIKMALRADPPHPEWVAAFIDRLDEATSAEPVAPARDRFVDDLSAEPTADDPLAPLADERTGTEDEPESPRELAEVNDDQAASTNGDDRRSGTQPTTPTEAMSVLDDAIAGVGPRLAGDASVPAPIASDGEPACPASADALTADVVDRDENRPTETPSDDASPDETSADRSTPDAVASEAVAQDVVADDVVAEDVVAKVAAAPGDGAGLRVPAAGDDRAALTTYDEPATAATAEAILPEVEQQAAAEHQVGSTGAPAVVEPAEASAARQHPPERAEEDAARGEPRRDVKATAAKKVIRVDQARIDQLMDLIGELIVAKNSLPYLAKRAATVHQSRDMARELKEHHAVMDRIAQDLQGAMMAVRMLPVDHVFQRFPRLVRDIARKLGKEIRLVLEGEETEADKTVIENLVDPLVHIVRNSVDHGIEMPCDREAAGKPRAGTIRLSAANEGDRVVIEIVDDGAGIDLERVRRKAVERGLLDSARAEAMSDEEAVNLIFAPGFSTCDVVSDLSGRGVGMDVVRTTVEKAGGTVVMHSKRGEGSRLRLSLPLTMAVTRVMTIECAGQLYGVPMDIISETVRVPEADFRRVKGQEVFVLRDAIVPVMRLSRMLGLRVATPTTDEASDGDATMVISVHGQRIGVVVDAFRDVMEVIVKPMEGILEGLVGYLGTSLLGDGRVVMIVDMKEILECRSDI